jgi:peptidoglycan/LPS O-acetylase OafA/YrhL
MRFCTATSLCRHALHGWQRREDPGNESVVAGVVRQYRDLVPRSGWIVLGSLVLLVGCSRLSALTARELLPIVLAYCVFYFAFSRQFWQAAKYGDFSYGTYLYAFPIQQLILAFTALSFPLFVGTSMVLSALAGVASWFAVERWFHHTREPLVSDIRIDSAQVTDLAGAGADR